MKIIVDAFGGDNAPEEIIKGCVEAVEEIGTEIVLVGDEGKIRQVAEKLELSEAVSKMEIIDCPDVITMDDDPMSVIKTKKNSSMAVGLKALADGRGDAFASAGNSGALTVGATMIVKRIRGIKRAAFAPVMPKDKGFFMLTDGGANLDVRPNMMVQFAIMASIYMKNVMGIENPRVGLANVGTEESKGDELRLEAYELLSKSEDINFIGNIEARDIPFDAADIVVTDGFTGNILLKLYEGVAAMILGKIKGIFTSGVKSKLAAAMIYGDMKGLKTEMDYNTYGGAPIMGATKPVFKIHGSAKASTVKNALRLTNAYAESGITEKISESIAKLKDGNKDTEK